MSTFLLAPDKFKGSLDAHSVASAIAEGIRRAIFDANIIEAPMADGGEGTLEILVRALQGQRRRVAATGPHGEPIEAPVGLIHQASTAVIELASIAGHAMVPEGRHNPLLTTTFGVGQAIRAAIETGIEEITLTLGGSATVDGGIGMMQALGMTFLDSGGRLIQTQLSGGDLAKIDRLVWDKPPDNFENVQFTIACDVLNPACGPNGAARIFGPQKGADEAGVRILEAGMEKWAGILERMTGRPLHEEPGTGAAGGVALPLLALANAHVVPGVDLVAECLGLAEKMIGADLVITGEGKLDRQSMMGKVVGAVGRMAQSAGVPCIALVGTAGEGADECLTLIEDFYALNGPIEKTAERLADLAESVIHDYQ
ncbi:MAG: glycerate kinase [Planctomycetes bacterium]|nr:glycerate kinase [Planctomycetota bacterium]